MLGEMEDLSLRATAKGIAVGLGVLLLGFLIFVVVLLLLGRFRFVGFE